MAAIVCMLLPITLADFGFLTYTPTAVDVQHKRVNTIAAAQFFYWTISNAESTHFPDRKRVYFLQYCANLCSCSTRTAITAVTDTSSSVCI